VIQFARAYPNLNLLPEAKNTSWHHIVNKYLAKQRSSTSFNEDKLGRIIVEAEYKPKDNPQLGIIWKELV